MTNQKIFFYPRGLGSDAGNGCFVCGKIQPYFYSNFAAFVESKEDGEEIVSWFGSKGAWLDYRSFEPTWIQVKVTSCEKHVYNLEKLQKLTRDNDNQISPNLIKEARQPRQA